MSAIRIQRVTSLDVHELQPYRTLRRPLDHIRQGIFVAEGEKVVRRLLASNITVVSFLMTEQWYDRLFSGTGRTPGLRLPADQWSAGTAAPANNQQASIYIAAKQLLETIVGFNLHQGIMAVAKIPESRSLEETLRTASKPHLLVALDGLVSAENVGVVVRNCAAFAVDAVITGEKSSSPYLRRAVRNSMGTVFQIPVIQVSDLAECLKSLSLERGIRVIAASPQGGATLHDIDATQDLCLVFGNEDSGISPKILACCRERVSIPMAGGIDSLNVASASAVFLSWVSRLRSDR